MNNISFRRYIKCVTNSPVLFIGNNAMTQILIKHNLFITKNSSEAGGFNPDHLKYDTVRKTESRKLFSQNFETLTSLTLLHKTLLFALQNLRNSL